LKSVIRAIGEKTKITCLMVSHDPLDVLSWADEILVIRKGMLVQRGTPPQVYNQPVNEYTASLFGAYNLIVLEEAKKWPGAAIPENSQDGKRLFFRPENLRLTKEKGPDDRALKGIVNKLNYFGSFYEIEIVSEFPIAGLPILARTGSCDLSRGDIVYLHLSEAQAWYL
jgi:ABC-type Fe3+/spermidine/putrescine transport system ATPase subunit